jgi:hypothetical protein
MMAIDSLRETMPIARISRAMEIPRSTIYYRGRESTGSRKARIPGNVETEIKRIAEERTTYGYRYQHYISLFHNIYIYINFI